jgi:hypothetical protein
MLMVNSGCGCPNLAGPAGLGFETTATDTSVSWEDYQALLDAYGSQGLNPDQAKAAAAAKVGQAGQLIAGVPNTYLIIGAAALLVLVSMQR